MQMKKLFMPLIVVMLMGMTTSAFAQLTCSVSSTPVSRATRTGHTEPAGDLTFTCSEGAAATDAATVTIDFFAPITNSTTYPGAGAAAGGISITNETGVFVGAVAVTSVSHVTGQVVISIDATAPDATDTSSFTLTNVLVSLVDVGTNNLRASLSVSPGDNISVVANQDEATVISSIRAGLGDVEVDEGPALWLATGAPVTLGDAGFTVTVEEGYIDAFRNIDDAPVGASNPVMLRFEFSGIPDGASIECDASIGATALLVGTALPGTVPAAWPFAGFGAEATVDADDSNLFAAFNLPPDLSTINTVTLDCGELGGSDGFDVGDADLPLTGNITVRVTLAPTGVHLDDLSNAANADDLVRADEGGYIPRFQRTLTPALTVLSFTPATTTMLVPLAMGTPALPSPFGSYDTGIAIANTTSDPFGDDGAFAQAGGLTFYFFPTTGDTFTIPSSTMSGMCGFNSAGALPTGRSFICNTSEILRAGGRTVAFSGYVFIVADFTNAHGTAFIYGGTPSERFTSATDVLVLNPPAVIPRLANPEPTFH